MIFAATSGDLIQALTLFGVMLAFLGVLIWALRQSSAKSQELLNENRRAIEMYKTTIEQNVEQLRLQSEALGLQREANALMAGLTDALRLHSGSIANRGSGTVPPEAQK